MRRVLILSWNAAGIKSCASSTLIFRRWLQCIVFIPTNCCLMGSGSHACLTFSISWLWKARHSPLCSFNTSQREVEVIVVRKHTACRQHAAASITSMLESVRRHETPGIHVSHSDYCCCSNTWPACFCRPNGGIHVKDVMKNIDLATMFHQGDGEDQEK